jgi:hypothetical protein
MVADGILAAAKRLPSATPAKGPDPAEPPVVLATRQTLEQPQSAPIDELIDAYIEFIASDDVQSEQADLSLLNWRQRMGSFYGLESSTSDEDWLLYAYSQVSSAGYLVDLQIQPRLPGVYNDFYSDAAACLSPKSDRVT